MTGRLFIVATPIGNLDDLSKRAVDTLQQVDVIAAEDTRHSKTLLQHFSINTPLVAYHDHNEEQASVKLIQQLKEGKNIALISDAGTPLINDPGYKLIKLAHEHTIKVVPVPGPSAVITALSVSGLPTNRFTFEGYLPAKTEARKKRLTELTHEQRTLIFYETPHRILESIRIMLEVFGEDRKVSIARELTKQFEQIVCGSLEEIHKQLQSEEIKIKGEFVIVVEGAEEQSISDIEVLRINKILAESLPPKEAAGLTAQITGKKKNEVYQLSLDN